MQKYYGIPKIINFLDNATTVKPVLAATFGNQAINNWNSLTVLNM